MPILLSGKSGFRYKHTCVIILLLLAAYTSIAQTKKTSQADNLSITDKTYSDTTDEYKLPDPNDVPGVDDDHTITTQTTEYIAPVAPKKPQGLSEPAQPATLVAKKMPMPALPTPTPDQQVYHYPEYMPRPPVDIKKYLRDNIHTPAGEKAKGIHGTVVVNFIINEDGSLSDFNIRKSLSETCDAEAIGIIRSMPHWLPGMMPGHKVVKTTYDLPVTFE